MNLTSSQSTIWQTLDPAQDIDCFEDVVEVFRMDAPAKANKTPTASRVPTVISVLDISEFHLFLGVLSCSEKLIIVQPDQIMSASC